MTKNPPPPRTKSIEAQALGELLRRFEPFIQSRITDRKTPEEPIIHELVKAIDSEPEWNRVSHAITARLVFRDFKKRHSDLQPPTLKQVSMFEEEEKIRATLQQIIIENGDGTITPFNLSVELDWLEKLDREAKQVRDVAEQHYNNSETHIGLRPYLIQGMTTEQAYIAWWRDSQAGKGPAS